MNIPNQQRMTKLFHALDFQRKIFMLYRLFNIHKKRRRPTRIFMVGYKIDSKFYSDSPKSINHKEVSHRHYILINSAFILKILLSLCILFLAPDTNRGGWLGLLIRLIIMTFLS